MWWNLFLTLATLRIMPHASSEQHLPLKNLVLSQKWPFREPLISDEIGYLRALCRNDVLIEWHKLAKCGKSERKGMKFEKKNVNFIIFLPLFPDVAFQKKKKLKLIWNRRIFCKIRPLHSQCNIVITIKLKIPLSERSAPYEVILMTSFLSLLKIAIP